MPPPIARFSGMPVERRSAAGLIVIAQGMATPARQTATAQGRCPGSIVWTNKSILLCGAQKLRKPQEVQASYAPKCQHRWRTPPGWHKIATQDNSPAGSASSRNTKSAGKMRSASNFHAHFWDTTETISDHRHGQDISFASSPSSRHSSLNKYFTTL